MKKLLYILLSFGLTTTLVPALAMASSATPAPKASLAAAKTASRISSLKTRGDKEIDRRIAGLNELVNRLGDMKHLAPDTLTDLSTKIQSQVADLTALKTKIDADTDETTLKTDVKSIVDSYRIFAVFMPQVHLLAASDSITDVATQFDALATKLDARIKADTNTANVTTMNTSLADMRLMIKDAQLQADAAQKEVATIGPEGFPANKTAMQTARTAIKKGYEDLQTARKDAAAIIKILKSEKTTESSSPKPTVSPSVSPVASPTP